MHAVVPIHIDSPTLKVVTGYGGVLGDDGFFFCIHIVGGMSDKPPDSLTETFDLEVVTNPLCPVRRIAGRFHQALLIKLYLIQVFLKGSESIGSTRLAYFQDTAKSKALTHSTTITLSKRLLAHSFQGFKEVLGTLYLTE